MTATTVEALGLTTGTWTIDPLHSEVGFTVRHLMTKVRGAFERFEGRAEVAENPTDSTVEVTIDLASVDTRSAQRDAHLQSADFFDVGHYPTMTFRSTGLTYEGDTGTLTGDLTIRDVTRRVELDAEFLGVQTGPQGETRAGFEATTQINRKDFGINLNTPLEGDRLLIGDKVDVMIAVQLVREA